MECRSALIAFPAGTGGEWPVDPMTVGVREGDVLLIGAHMQSECAREGVWDEGGADRNHSARSDRMMSSTGERLSGLAHGVPPMLDAYLTEYRLLHRSPALLSQPNKDQDAVSGSKVLFHRCW